MQADDETIATQLQHVLEQSGYKLSLSTIRRARYMLGWTFHGTRYCQLIRAANNIKRLEWATNAEKDNFDNVIWSDETSVQLECHQRECFRKANQPPKLKPKPKHPIKVHVWAAISKQGATEICIFEGKMDAPFYVQVLECHLLPFIHSNFSASHGFIPSTLHVLPKNSLTKTTYIGGKPKLIRSTFDVEQNQKANKS